MDTMIKTAMRPTNVFDTDVVHVGDKIKYEFCYVDGSIYDWGYGEILSVSEDALCIDYYSEIDSEMDYLTMKIKKKYNQFCLDTKEVMSNLHKIEILS